MKYHSTANKNHTISFKEAVIKGLAPDRGLYFPVDIPMYDPQFFEQLSSMTLPEIAFEVMWPYVLEVILKEDMKSICEEVFNFKIPLVAIQENTYSLELYHGPTLAFKDVGARFMSRCLSHFGDRKVKILVATSGDTGSAVANGFYNVPGVEVVILYPSGKVSDIQEQQLTTLGGNITALEVDGVFDDCQYMVKEAFLDEELNIKMNLSSANSINIARWLPQSIYYYWMVAQLQDVPKPISVAVPSGNFGNITAGLLAKASGLPIDQFIAATNINDIIPQYLETGIYVPRPSKSTISNAMDVGDPSNYLRLLALYNNDYESIKKNMDGFSLNDTNTKNKIAEVFKNHDYLLDPHGAVAYAALEKRAPMENVHVVLETAHPIKFRDVVEPIINETITAPARLQKNMDGTKASIKIKNTYEALKAFLLA